MGSPALFVQVTTVAPVANRPKPARSCRWSSIIVDTSGSLCVLTVRLAFTTGAR
jgi:hypothetical protein